MRKFYNYKTFKIDEQTEIECRTQDTSYGFRHLATLLINGHDSGQAKCCYQNRTWERFEYESVMRKLIDKIGVFHKSEKSFLYSYIENYKEGNSMLKSVGLIAKLGNIFSDKIEDKNDWKKRMLKAGVKGIDIPDDFDSLSEEEKERRLNGVIKTLTEEGGE